MNKTNIKLLATHSIDIFVVWTNTDLTEGRGSEYPLHVCGKESTALRLAKHCSVQGCDGRITKDKAYYINGSWYMPNHVVYPSPEDEKVEIKMQAEKEKQAKKDAAIEKAKKLGLSQEDIESLKL